MANVTCTYKVTTQSTQQPPAGPGTATALSRSQSLSFQVSTSGTASDQADQKYTATLLLNAANTTIDLTNMTDDYGNVVNMKRVKSIFMKNRATTDGYTVTVSPGAANGFNTFLSTNSTMILQNSTAANDGGILVTAPGTTAWATAAAAKTLTFNPGANAITIDLEIIGASA